MGFGHVSSVKQLTYECPNGQIHAFMIAQALLQCEPHSVRLPVLFIALIPYLHSRFWVFNILRLLVRP